jgi:hypothetical protein
MPEALRISDNLTSATVVPRTYASARRSKREKALVYSPSFARRRAKAKRERICLLHIKGFSVLNDSSFRLRLLIELAPVQSLSGRLMPRPYLRVCRQETCGGVRVNITRNLDLLFSDFNEVERILQSLAASPSQGSGSPCLRK